MSGTQRRHGVKRVRRAECRKAGHQKGNMASPLFTQEQMEVSNRAFQLQLENRPQVPDPRDVIPLCVPMKFNNHRRGQFKIVKETSKKFPVATMRHAFMYGVKPLTLEFAKPATFHRLTKGKGEDVLTSDVPQEVYTQYIEFHKAHGNVLVGGLGLGMAATMIKKLPGVRTVTVVEIEPKIISLVQEQLPSGIEVIQGDLYEYLKSPLQGSVIGKYDFAYHDIWYRTGEGTWVEHIVPLARLTRKAGINETGFWGEQEMKGQLISSLYQRTYGDEEYSQWKPYWVFRQGVKKTLGEGPYTKKHEPEVLRLIHLYIDEIGTPEWEKTFPWDEFK